MGARSGPYTVRDMKSHTQALDRCQIRQSPKDTAKLSFQLLAATFALLAVVIVTAGLSACAGYTSAAHTAATQSAGAGVLSASSVSISFGNVAVGSNSTQSLSLTNTGTATANISQAAISGAGFTVLGASPSGSVGVGQSVTVEIQFAPQSSGAASGTLSVVSDASNSPASISLTGMGTQPGAGLTVSPSSLSFGSVAVGQNITQIVQLTNNENANVVLNLATMAGSAFAMSGLSLPMTIGAGQSLSFSVRFSPTASGSATGSITFTDAAANSPQVLNLAGSGTSGNASLTLNPANVAFGNVPLGSTGKQTVTVTNSGTSTMTISQVSAGGAGFSASGISVPLSLPGGGNTSFTVQFAPSTMGSAIGNITVAASGGGSSPNVTVELSGMGTQVSLAVSPQSVAFGSVLVGTTASYPVTLTNPGNASATVSAMGISGSGFSLNGVSTPITVGAGQSAAFTVRFAPTTTGNASGTLSITSNAPGSPITVPVSGSASNSQPELTVNPPIVNFGNINVGSNASQNVSLSNSGSAALTVSAVTPSGVGITVNGISLPQTLSPGASTTFAVQFAPTTPGNVMGSVSITSTAPDSPSTAVVTGSGMQAAIGASPSSVSFGSVTTGTSNSQPISISNSGNTTLTISQFSIGGNGFSTTGLSTPLTIAAGKSASFNAVFTPSSATNFSGSISLFSNAPNSPLTISLTGAGAASAMTLSASPSSLAFGSVSDETSSSQSVTITNTGNANVTVSAVSVTGAGFGTSGVNTGLTLTPNQNVTLKVSFNPTSAGAVNGQVTVTSNATNSPLLISASGTGVANTSHSVALMWTSSSSSGVVGYYVYRGTTPGVYSKITGSAVAGTSYTDTSVQSGQDITYYYVVTAVDGNGAESSDSNQATATVP